MDGSCYLLISMLDVQKAASYIFKKIESFRKYTHFVVCGYVNFWFLSSLLMQAPRDALILFKTLVNGAKEFGINAWKMAFRKFTYHLWYSNSDLRDLSLFDAELQRCQIQKKKGWCYEQ